MLRPRHSRARRLPAPTQLVGALLGTLAVFGLLLGLSLHRSAASIALLALAISAVSLCVREFDGDLLKPSFVVLCKLTVFYVVGAFVFLLTTPRLMPQVYALALAYALLALVCFYGGYRSKLGTSLGTQLPVLRSRWNRANVVLVTVACLVIGTAAFWSLLLVNGGFVNFVSHLHNRTRLVQGWGPLRLLVDFVGVGVSIGYLGSLTILKKSRLFKLVVACLFLYWCGICLALGGRGFIFFQVVLLLFLRQQLLGRLGLARLAMLGASILTVLLMLGEIREAIPSLIRGREGEAVSTMKERANVEAVFRRNFPFFKTLTALVAEIPERRGYYLGRTYLEALAAPVPRRLWPAKPFGVTSEVNFILEGRHFYHSGDLREAQSGVDVRLIDEAYLNFGAVGIALAFFVLGVVVQIFSTFVRRAREDAVSLLLAAWAFPFVIHYLDGASYSNLLRAFELLIIGAALAVGFRSRLLRVRRKGGRASFPTCP